MTEAFLQVVRLSASATWLALAVMGFRLLLKGAPKSMRLLLWGLVAFRLICPITLESPLSLVPEAVQTGQGFLIRGQVYGSQAPTETATLPDSGSADAVPEISPGLTEAPSVDVPAVPDVSPDPVETPAGEPVDVTAVLAGIWIAGMGVLGLYAAGSYLLLYLRMRTAIRLRDNIYQSEFTDSPFVLGFLRPRIYLPFDIEQRDLPHIMAHERAHIARHDHWWKPLGYLLLTVHWFNPVMWAAYILLCRDIELACDEKVIREMENRQRADYSQSLLTCSIHRRMILACPVAFGEVGVKERVRNVLNYRKPGLWITLLTVLAMVVSLVCFATVQPAQAEETPTEVTEPQTADWEANRGSSTEMVNSTGIGYTLKATQVTPTGMRLVFVADQSTAFLRNEYFWIEKQTEAGWTALERHMEDPVLMADEVYTSGNAFFGGYDWPVDWSGIYGVLEPGTYRLWTTVYAGEEPVSVEFTIGDPGESLKAQALERYYAALDELLTSGSCHLEVVYKDVYDSMAETGVCNDMTRSVYLRSGNDRMYLFVDGVDKEASDGSMIRDGMEYRAENEKHFDRTTPMVGWFRDPGMRLSVYTDWLWVYNWTMDDVVSAEMTEDTVTLNLGSDGSATIRFDGDGKLEEIEKLDTSGHGEDARTVTYTLRVMDTSAEDIQAWIDGQDVEFCREFDWEAESFADAEVADRAFVNTDAVVLNSVSQVIDRAEAECTVPYSNVLVHHDAQTGIWKVEFQVGYGKAYTETVYMTDDGVTVKIATFGPLDI